MTVSNCRIVEIPHRNDARGNLGFIEPSDALSFEMKRIYYLYDVPGGAERGAHAHRELHQLVIALSGSFDIELYDGVHRKTVTLNRAFQGLYICPFIWRELRNFSSGAVCLVVASEIYDEADYIRDINQFEREVYA